MSAKKKATQSKKKEMTEDRSNMVGDLIGTARRIKKVDDDIINYKKTITNGATD